MTDKTVCDNCGKAVKSNSFVSRNWIAVTTNEAGSEEYHDFCSLACLIAWATAKEAQK